MHQKTVPIVPRILAVTGMLVWGAMFGKDLMPRRSRKAMCVETKDRCDEILEEGDRSKVLWRREFELPMSKRDSPAQAERCIIDSCQRHELPILQKNRMKESRIKPLPGYYLFLMYQDFSQGLS